ncbi:MAG: hypothetical protein R3320_07535 [Nitriliruptorales bacterium]|nr:hypothetical protein [Nitriliruptorales bacterium]
MKRALIATTAAVMALNAGPAAAAPPQTFLADASAVGLEMTIQGEGLTIGYSEAIVEEGGESEAAVCAEGAVACAIAAGELALGETAKSWWPGNAEKSVATAFALPADVSPLLTATIGEAVADTSDAPHAVAEGGAAELTVTATQTLYNALPQELRDGLEQLTTELEDATAEDPTGIIGRAFSTVDQLRDNIESAPILQVFAGGSDSVSSVDGDVVTTTAEAIGSTIVVAPFPESTEDNPQGLAIVNVGKATATATSDQFAASSDFSPAIVSLHVFNATDGTYQSVPVEGDTGCALEGTPLQVCVTAGYGTKTVDGSSAAARADAVRVEAFPDTLAVSLRLASAEVGVGAAPPPAPAPARPEEPSMPRTGGGLVLPGALLLAGALGLRRFLN